MKTALITGASSEVGLAIAKKLENDYDLILTEHKTTIDINEFNKKPTIYKVDLNNEESILQLIFELKNKKIDLLINVAAFDQNEEIEEITLENLKRTININTIAPFLLIQKLFQKDNQGIVINIASTDGIDTYNIYNLPYAISKAALIHLTKQLNNYYENLYIYALCPNYINTNTVQLIEPKFLEKELKRVKQEKLIEIEEVVEKIEEIIEILPNEIIIRME